MKILIADDSSVCRIMLQRTLKPLGHDVTAVVDGTQAAEVLEKEQFPVMITDWEMPGLDGPSLCRHLRSQEKDHYTYVIMLTCLGSDNYVTAIEAGADDFLVKPFEEAMLVARLLVADRVSKLRAELDNLQRHWFFCPRCQRVRGDDHCWNPLEDFLTEVTPGAIDRAVCPPCRARSAEVEQQAMRQLRQRA